jgi:hypothetical protein
MIWRAKYEQVLADTNSQPQAIKAGNEAVQAAMPSHTLAEMPGLIRNHSYLGALVIFYSDRSKMYNMMAESYHDRVTRAWNDPGKSKADFATSLSAHVGGALGMLLTGSILAEFAMGHGKKEDEEWGQWWARRSLAAPFTTLPLVGEAATVGANALFSEKKVDASRLFRPPGFTPIFNTIDTIGRLASENRGTSSKIWDVAELALVLLGLPSAQPRRTGEAAVDMARGAERPKDPAEALHKLLFGVSSKESSPLHGNTREW